MKRKRLYSERLHYNEQGFDVIDVCEDGTVLTRHFVKTSKSGHYHTYKETERSSFKPEGKIRIDKVDFSNEPKIRKTEFENHLTTIATFTLDEWKEARKQVVELQKETEDDLTVDYQSVLELDESSVKERIPSPSNKKAFTIVSVRATMHYATIERTKHPEQLAFVYIPELNENLYINHIPGHKHITVTGDNLFALETRQTDETLSDDDFWRTVETIEAQIVENLEYYRSLINKQRERRAAIDTDAIGDLYPR